MKSASFLYALALVLLPFSYAVKGMLLIFNIPWIDPSLILGLIVFALIGAPIKDKRALWIIVWAFLSAYIGSFFLGVTAHTIDRPKSPLYILYVEPCRLALNIVWFWVSIKFFTEKRDFVIRWLAISVAIQLSIAIYLYLGLYGLTQVPGTVALYLYIYTGRQTLWFGDSPLYRMAGTFDESPPFGLFMFSCFVIFILWLVMRTNFPKRHKKWAILGGIVSFVGAVASLSDQVLLAIAIFGTTWYFGTRLELTGNKRIYRSAEAILAIALILGVSGYAISRVIAKGEEAAAYRETSTTDVEGTSGAERAFHLRYALERFEEVPLAIWTGIGPGRYGDYAFRTGLFAPTVTIQNMPLTWLVEYGLLGSALICAWLWHIFKRAKGTYAALAAGALVSLLVAAISQANWLWEGWFLALAFLYSSSREAGSVGYLASQSHARPVQ